MSAPAELIARPKKAYEPQRRSLALRAAMATENCSKRVSDKTGAGGGAMTAEVETDEPIPSWLPHALLYAIREVASKSDPVRAGDYAGVDPDRVRRAIDRADGILAAHRCHGDDDVIDVALAQAALMVARAMIRLRTRETHGR